MLNNLTNILVITIIALKIAHIEAELKCYKHPPEVATETCCPLPNFYTEEIKAKCNSTDNHFKMDLDHKHQCFVACAINEIGIFKDGDFLEDKFDSYLHTALVDTPEVIDGIKEDFNKCMKNYEIVGKMMIKDAPCALYHDLIMGCVFIKTIKKCPDTLWSNTEDCNEIRDYWQKCLPAEL